MTMAGVLIPPLKLPPMCFATALFMQTKDTFRAPALLISKDTKTAHMGMLLAVNCTQDGTMMSTPQQGHVVFFDGTAKLQVDVNDYYYVMSLGFTSSGQCII